MGLENVDTDEALLFEAKNTLLGLATWSDELPEKFMETPDPGYGRHKYRTAWFQGVLSSVLCVADVVGDRELASAAENLAARERAKDSRVRTTREEINECDALLARALAKL